MISLVWQQSLSLKLMSNLFLKWCKHVWIQQRGIGINFIKKYSSLFRNHFPFIQGGKVWTPLVLIISRVPTGPYVSPRGTCYFLFAEQRKNAQRSNGFVQGHESGEQGMGFRLLNWSVTESGQRSRTNMTLTLTIPLSCLKLRVGCWPPHCSPGRGP